jgi:membrane protein implicated in regulation of membrane protease activity
LLSVYTNFSKFLYAVICSNILLVLIFLIGFPVVILVYTSYLLNYLFQLFLALIFSITVSTIVKYLVENKDKTKLNKALSEYVSKAIAEEIL